MTCPRYTLLLFQTLYSICIVLNFRHQHNSSVTYRVPPSQIINSGKDSRNKRHVGGAIGDKFSESDQHVTEDNSPNGIIQDESDLQLIVTNYTDNTEGLFTRNVDLTVKLVSMAPNDATRIGFKSMCFLHSLMKMLIQFWCKNYNLETS